MAKCLITISYEPMFLNAARIVWWHHEKMVGNVSWENTFASHTLDWKHPCEFQQLLSWLKYGTALVKEILLYHLQCVSEPINKITMSISRYL